MAINHLSPLVWVQGVELLQYIRQSEIISAAIYAKTLMTGKTPKYEAIFPPLVRAPKCR
jgi:hypothetical protein